MDIPIAQIKVANRFRKDLGDIKSLASSIVAVGLMHPIVIRDDNQLIAGERRLEACKMLGWKEIPVTILNIKKIIAGELYENLARKDFTMSERIAILEEIERQRIGHKTSKAKGDNLTLFQKEHKSMKSRTIVSEYTGISEGQLAKEKLIVKAGRDEPSKFSSLVAKIDHGKLSVDKAYRRLQNRRLKDELIANNGEVSFTKADDKLRLFEGDFKKVAFEKLAPSSIDLVFTDPPYLRKSLTVYADLAILADRVLKPGGSLVTYIGQYALLDILDQVRSNSKDLQYWWEICIVLEGPFARHWHRQVVVKWKPLLWFAKGKKPQLPDYLDDLVVSQRADKLLHDWQQSSIEAEHVIKFLTVEGQTVLDPFLGAGTTAVAAIHLRRLFIGIDIDPNALDSVRANLRLNLAENRL
jgi:ParB-like nuclease domain/DNA methylase